MDARGRSTVTAVSSWSSSQRATSISCETELFSIAEVKPGGEDIAVRAVQHQRTAQPPTVQQGLQALVLGVVPAHESDLHQPPAEPPSASATRSAPAMHHRLLAQHRQTAVEGREHRLLVRGPGEAINTACTPGASRAAATSVCTETPSMPGDGVLGAPGVGIGHRRHRGAVHHPVDPSYVVGPHVARTQDRDTQQLTHALTSPADSSGGDCLPE